MEIQKRRMEKHDIVLDAFSFHRLEAPRVLDFVGILVKMVEVGQNQTQEIFEMILALHGNVAQNAEHLKQTADNVIVAVFVFERLRLEMNTGISPAILVPTEGEESFLYMVLPVRLKGSDHV